MAILEFNANEVEPNQDFEVLPTGKYLAIIENSDIKSTASNKGQFLELKFQIIEGEHKSKVVFGRLNIVNENQQAMQIAQGHLSSICRAVGVMEIQDSSQLHDKPLVISVKKTTRRDNGEPTNEIKSFMKKGVAADQPQQNTGNAPWSRNA